MDHNQLDASLARFVADLTVAGEATVFDVVVERHLDFLLHLRAMGLRWPGVLRLLTQAGAQRYDGTDLSPDQFRASISRAKRRRAAQVEQQVTSHPQNAPAPALNRPVQRNIGERRRSNEVVDDMPVAPSFQSAPAAQQNGNILDPDITEDELATVRQRLG